MFTKAELIDAIDELQSGRHSIQNCLRLASVYTVLDHLYPDEGVPDISEKDGYSGLAEQPLHKSQMVGLYGDTDFLRAISGRDSQDMWIMMDELVSAIKVLNPRLYSNFMTKIG